MPNKTFPDWGVYTAIIYVLVVFLLKTFEFKTREGYVIFYFTDATAIVNIVWKHCIK